MMREKKGFTIAELLVVVAIIAILVGISIPAFTAQLEKARRTVDIANARALEAQLAVMINDGTIEFPTDGKAHVVGALVQHTDKVKPAEFNAMSGVTLRFVVDSSENNGKARTTINGIANNTWDDQNSPAIKELYSMLASCFRDGKMYSRANKANNGWDWYYVICYQDVNGKITIRTFSGEDGKTAKIESVSAGSTNIEKMMNRSGS